MRMTTTTRTAAAALAVENTAAQGRRGASFTRTFSPAVPALSPRRSRPPNRLEARRSWPKAGDGPATAASSSTESRSPQFLHFLEQRLASARQTGHHRAHRKIEHARDVRIRKVRVHAKRQNPSVLLREVAQRPLHVHEALPPRDVQGLVGEL